jgi:hypothetical protein
MVSKEIDLLEMGKTRQMPHDTGLRAIEDLIRKKALAKDAAGDRSASYSLLDVK